MGVSDPKPGERLKDVRFTDDTLIVELLDGQLWFRWLSVQSFWMPALKASKTESLAALASASTGRISMRT